LPVLPDDGLRRVHEYDAIVRAASTVRCARRLGPGGRSGPRDERAAVGQALGIVRSDDRRGARDARSVPEGPDDIALTSDLDNPVVVLIRDENVAGRARARAPVAPGIGLVCELLHAVVFTAEANIEQAKMKHVVFICVISPW
jgi:hypothetical protein